MYLPDSNVSNMASFSSSSCVTNLSVYPLFKCFDIPVSFYMFVGFTLTNLLVLPLYITIVWLGFQRWRLQRSAASTGQSDVFAYHTTAVDVSSVLGSLLFAAAIYMCNQWMKTLGYYFFSFAFPAQTFLHCLTCLERYAAVVYPLTYRRLRLVRGSRIRNVSIVCVLLLCLAMLGFTALYFPRFPTAPFFATFVLVVLVVLFCSVSILRVLFHSGVGKAEPSDGLKLRAFYTVVAITGALALRSAGLMATSVIFDVEGTVGSGGCFLLMSGLWMCLPSNLVLPLLFLQRATKL